jgi:hypothetical protein
VVSLICQNRDGVGTIEALAVPQRSRGIRCYVGCNVFGSFRLWWRREFHTVAALEPEPTTAKRDDPEIPVMQRDMVPFAQDHQIVEICTATEEPEQNVMSVQIPRVRAPGMSAMPLLA